MLLNRLDEFPGIHTNESLWGKVGKASISFLTNTLKVLVRDSRMSIGIFDNITAGPHHFRKLAASYSAKLFSSANDEVRLRKKLGCSEKSKILDKVYIKEVPPLVHTCVLPLGTYHFINPQ